MAHHTTITPSMERARQLGDIALTKSEGLTISFLTSTFGSVEGAKSAALSLQTSFSAMRVRTRNRSMTLDQKRYLDLGINVVGPYDRLACIKREMPNREGYYIFIGPSYVLDFAMDVTDTATGERLPEFSARAQRMNIVINIWTTAAMNAKTAKVPFRNPLSVEDEEWLFREEPEEAVKMFAGMRITPRGKEPPIEDNSAPQDDLVNFNLNDPNWGQGDLAPTPNELSLIQNLKDDENV